MAWSWHPSQGAAFYLYKDGPAPNDVEVIGKDVMALNGHCTFLPGNEWILNDCYGGQTEGRLQELYLYQVASGQRTELGAYHTPAAYEGEWRCDLHPRFSPDGASVVIDSPHGGNGRQMYLLDISSIATA